MNCYKSWLLENRNKLILVFVIYQVAILSIGIINYPYIDDVIRQLDGRTDFAWAYSRWGSEIASWLVQGSRHLTDMGLTTHILTGIILSFSSIIVVYVLNGKKLEWMPVTVSILIGINPWFLQCISFRFDSPYMALSILVSFIPFLWWNKNKCFFIASIVGVFLMCNTYQGSSGLYIIMVLALTFKTLTSNNSFLPSLKKVTLAAIAYVLAMIMYIFVTKLNPEMSTRDTAAIANIRELPSIIVRNITEYFSTIINQSAKIWIVFLLILLILFLISSIFRSEVSPAKSFIYSLVYLALGSIMSYGVFLISEHSLVTMAPRYGYGLSIFASITLIMLTQKINVRFLDISIKVVASLLFYYILTFSFIYASTLNVQKEAFERQSVILSTDLKNIVNNDRKQVYMNKLFKDSPVLLNSTRNYPILRDLVPKNESLYWPNITLFNTYSGLNVNIQPFDFNNFDSTSKNLETSNYYYDIFSEKNKIYIIVKD
ncbi:hypothetical protein BCR26_03345 [Enterococcus rivorum]|uniref:PcfV n=1 Tax=Enterococcus rivorum TaxID=762845 RepID=A0A1E5KVN0_9ENTE|nr:hypothetical protein BCR26_03345 [Enterococcus rivorum]